MDSETSNRLLLQVFAFKNAIVLDEPLKQALLDDVLEVIKKLNSVKYHRDNLIRIVREELDARNTSKEQSVITTIDLSTGAEKEFEALLLQAKATLDVLVKVLEPIAGLKLATYGAAGTGVIKQLKNNLSDPLKPRAEWLLSLVEAGTPWVKQWVGSYRDTIAHYRSIESSGFVGIPDENGHLQFCPPTDRTGVRLTDVAKLLFEDLVTFCEEFLVCAYRRANAS